MCVRAIAENAFTQSEYPVIITIENHCDKEHQAEMAAMLQSELGDMLYIPEVRQRFLGGYALWSRQPGSVGNARVGIRKLMSFL